MLEILRRIRLHALQGIADPRFSKDYCREIATEIDAANAEFSQWQKALSDLLEAYGEAHALYDLGDCDASVAARELLKQKQ